MVSTSEYLDAVFDTLRSPMRRHSLTYLQDDSVDHAASVDDIATYLSGKTGITADRVKTSLIHTHLPKLKEQGWIDYDERQNIVHSLTTSSDTKDRLLLDYLSETTDEEDEHLDTVFQVLSKEDRRRILYLLEEDENHQSSVDELVDELAGSDEEKDMMRTSLYHVHIPKLTERSWVSYDEETDDIRLELDEFSDPDGLLLQYLENAYESEQDSDQ